MLPVVMFKKEYIKKKEKKQERKKHKKRKGTSKQMSLHINTNSLYIGIYVCMSVTKTKMKHLLTFK